MTRLKVSSEFASKELIRIAYFGCTIALAASSIRTNEPFLLFDKKTNDMAVTLEDYANIIAVAAVSVATVGVDSSSSAATVYQKKVYLTGKYSRRPLCVLFWF